MAPIAQATSASAAWRGNGNSVGSLHSAALSSPSVPGERVAAAARRVLYAPDQLELLRAARYGFPHEHAPTERPKRANAKGEPMPRFTTTVASFSSFHSVLSAHNTSLQCRRAQIQQVGLGDELYAKVQQIPWERDIMWKGLCGANGADKEEEFGVEVDVVDGFEPPAVRFQARDDYSERKISTLSLPESSEADCHSGSAVVCADRKRKIPESSSFSQQKRLRMQSPSGLDESTSFTQAELDFDMAKPRNYRWEIKDSEKNDKSRVSLPRPSTVLQDSMNVARAENLPCPLNENLLNDSWIDAIGWNSTKDLPETMLVLDENNSLLIFSAPDTEENRPILRIPQRKIGAAELRLEQMEEQRRAKRQRIEDFIYGKKTTDDRHSKEGGGKRHNIRLVHHSLSAIKLSLAKPELSNSRLRAFHRPRGKFKINEQLQFAPPPSNPTLSKVIMHIMKSSDLNPTTGGKLILLEYTEQNPPMLSSPGMAARVMHYWHPPGNVDDSVSTKSPTEEAPLPPQMEISQVVTLDDREDSPFIGDVPAGRVVTSLNSKMLKIPLFPHRAVPPFVVKPEDRDSGEYELFLLCRPVSKSKKSGQATSVVHLMEIPPIFTAGQVEPQMEVPAPNSRSMNDIIRPYMAFHILRLFKKSKDGERLKIEDATHAFPIRKFQTDIRVVRYIEKQLQLTAWNLTNNYVECHLQGNRTGILALSGVGDLTGRSEGFSFVRAPPPRAKRERGGEKGAFGAGEVSTDATQTAVAGTTADLRKLKMKEAGVVLRNLGFPEADIKNLRRWDRIHMIRELSTRANVRDVAGCLTGFARDDRNTLSAQQQQDHRKKCNEIYERQMDVLSSTKTTFSSDEESESGDEDALDEWKEDIEAGIITGGGNGLVKFPMRGLKHLLLKGGGELDQSNEALAEHDESVELRRLVQEMKEVDNTGFNSTRRPDVDASMPRGQMRARGIKDRSSLTPTSGASIEAMTEVLSELGSSSIDQAAHSLSPAHGREATSRRKVLKRITRRIEEDGTETIKIEFIFDDKQIGQFKAIQDRKILSQTKKKERSLLRKRLRELTSLKRDSDSRRKRSRVGNTD